MFSLCSCLFHCASIGSASWTPARSSTPSLTMVELSLLLIPLLVCVALGLGTTLSAKDFKKAVKRPRGILVVNLVHYLFQPLMAFIFALILPFTNEEAVGVLLVGCSPMGTTSSYH